MNKRTTYPPKFFLHFFRWFCHPKLLDRIEGDLMELYYARVKKLGRLRSNIKFIIDVLLLFRPGIIRPIEGYKNLNTYGMLRNYFTVGWRNLLRNSGNSFINVAGLTAGMSVAMFIGIWVLDEFSYNTSHKNYNHIAEVYEHKSGYNEIQTTGSAPAPLAVELKNSFKDDFKNVVRMWWQSNHTLSIDDRRISSNGTFMDKEALDLFSFEIIKGSHAGLNDPASIVLSESTAKALFGTADPINQLIKIDNRNDLIVKVTGVYKEIPFNSRFHSLQFISSWDLWTSANGWMKEGEHDWNGGVPTFVEIAPTASFEALSKKIEKMKFNSLPREQALSENPRLFLQPMSRWYLYSQWKDGQEVGGRIQFVWLFSAIGIFVLLLACINFVNLSTAHAELRAKEIGIRKSIGSIRAQLIWQFFIESFLIVMVAFIVSLIVVTTLLPWFNELADKQMYMPWTHLEFYWMTAGFILFTSIASGFYPALFLSSFQPIKVLKGTFKAGRYSDVPRRALVVVQFSVSMILIIGTTIVWKQIQYAKDRPVGYTRNGLIMVRKNSPDFWGKREIFRNKLKGEDAIVELAESASPATETWFTENDFNWQGKDPNAKIDFACNAVTHDYGKMMGWNFMRGRDYSRDHSTDSSAVILNETAARMIGWQNPIDEEIIYKGKRYKVIGVIQDVIADSPYEPVKQSIYFLQSNTTLNSLGNVWLTIRLNPRLSTLEAITRTEKVFQSVLSAVPFEFRFVDQEYAIKFSAEERVGKLASVFAVLAIFISCIGLFGLSSFVAGQRTKEIGLRKVMGASVFNLWKMLSSDFIKLVIISVVIAIPIAYYVMENWLSNYSYRTKLEWWIFVVAGLCALLITLLTVSYKTIKAATINPVSCLRSD